MRRDHLFYYITSLSLNPSYRYNRLSHTMIQKALRIARTLAHIIIFIILTVFTQVGGIIYLLSRRTHPLIMRKVSQPVLQPLAKLGTFLIIYVFSTLTVIPLLAKPFGRVPLPVFRTKHLQPLRLATCLMNRHYVRPALKAAVLEIADKMGRYHPGTTVNYLDGGFPFLNSYPMLPHLSHNDGKKLDLSFLYLDKASGAPSDNAPSIIGYGICEEPRPGERNTAERCREQGYRWYDVLQRIVPQENKKNYVFDSLRMKALMTIITFHPDINKVFIEPHLRTRLELDSDKIRFHGCGAVRHDDHIHIQL